MNDAISIAGLMFIGSIFVAGSVVRGLIRCYFAEKYKFMDRARYLK